MTFKALVLIPVVAAMFATAGCETLRNELNSPERNAVSKAFDYPTGIVPKCPAQTAVRAPYMVGEVDYFLGANGTLAAAVKTQTDELVAAYYAGATKGQAYEKQLAIGLASTPWVAAYLKKDVSQVTKEDIGDLFVTAITSTLASFARQSVVDGVVKATPCLPGTLYAE